MQLPDRAASIQPVARTNGPSNLHDVTPTIQIGWKSPPHRSPTIEHVLSQARLYPLMDRRAGFHPSLSVRSPEEYRTVSKDRGALVGNYNTIPIMSRTISLSECSQRSTPCKADILDATQLSKRQDGGVNLVSRPGFNRKTPVRPGKLSWHNRFPITLGTCFLGPHRASMEISCQIE